MTLIGLVLEKYSSVTAQDSLTGEKKIMYKTCCFETSPSRKFGKSLTHCTCVLDKTVVGPFPITPPVLIVNKCTL